VVRILAYNARGLGFESRTVETFVHEPCLFVLVLGDSMYNMYVLTKKKVRVSIFICYLESITQALLNLD
jgi:hypothetical protein